MADAVIGIDIGGTNIVIGLVSIDGTILAQNSLKTSDYPQFSSFADDAINIIQNIVKENNAKLLGVGIGAPNGNYIRGTIEHAVNLSWNGIIEVSKYFENLLGVETRITNDANAAAVGEKVFGGAKDLSDFVVITLGTGLGSGFYINGKLLYGHSGFAGELGHILLVQNGRICGCGNKGCAESYVSATGLCRTALEILAARRDESILREYSDKQLTSKIIFDAAISGDAISLEVFDITSRYLGQILSDTVAFSSPEKIFLFGGLANAGDLLLRPAENYARELCLKNMRDSFSVEVSSVPMSSAAVLGAAALIWDTKKF